MKVKNKTNHSPKETLGSVREILSDETFANPAYKGVSYFLRDLFFFVIVTVLLWNVDSWYVLPFLWFFAGMIISALFVVGHDCAHEALFKSKFLQYWIGQIAMLPSLHAYNQWGYGHNRIHHGHTIKRQADFVWHPTTKEEYSEFRIFKKLMHRFFWSIWGGGFYYMIEIWFKGMVLFTAPLKEAKRDKLIMLSFAFISSGLVFYFGASSIPGVFDIGTGLWMFTKVCLIPFIAWNYFMGITVYVHHIHSEIPWKTKEEWTPFYGQMKGTVNYHINPIMNFFFHNIFIHMPHHVHMKIPFYNLKRALNEIKVIYGDYVLERNTILGDYLKSTSLCKVIDSDTGKWMTYREAEEMTLKEKDLESIPV
ncbi:fatty acid desaturase [Leptospira interrogans]|uniref:fatty acid desaturase n=1 Tax=Leptospira interrogans TaxID=173 RepID=UPI0002980E75|nr:fatty acid desaturase [Leptospira interrogans]EKO97801.1 stearoyl-CoA 9-desaturase [Leptospira interrogans str. Brem 329]MCD1166306.1 fatty acid desaturase [Leptospira interrogans]MCH1887673.1 fatty acid desaturase [Leptospira interrogans]MCH1893971.1 fatty acid desaturase [Leptospira interrogans]MCH1900728.1 fatty acid desaturase [Leptospira interrogans]